MGPLKVSFPHLYRKRGGDRDVSARATHLKAATENVSVTTIERKQMSNKTHFKRVALAVVTALGFGVLATSPAGAAHRSDTLELSTATASITAGETATTVVTQTFLGVAAGDSLSVTVASANAATSAKSPDIGFYPILADSSGVAILGTNGDDTFYAGVTANNTSATVKYNMHFLTATSLAAGTYTFYIYAGVGSGGGTLVSTALKTFTVTVAAADLKPAAAKSTAVLGTGTQSPYVSTAADSALVVTAGTYGSYAEAATVAWQQMNSAGSTSTLTPESVSVTMSGAGAFSVGYAGSKVQAATVKFSDTITVWSDGRTGTGTITLATTSMPGWKTKTITFAGTASTASITVPKLVLSTSASANDVRISPKDSASNLVTTANNWYLHSSDTRVITNSTSQISGSATTALGYATLSITSLLADSGTAKIKFANYAADSTTPTTGAVVTNEVEVSVVGKPATFKLSTNKKTYAPGEVATVTISVLDGLGKAVADTAIAAMLTSTGVTANGNSTSSGDTITTTAATHGQGKYTYEYTMPSTSGNVLFKGTGSTGLLAVGQVAVYETVTVTDPAENAANSALDAAQEATDAAIAATDAAVLAQESADAAAVAAEAAAETAAEAAEAAKAAVDAVTKLSGEVTKLLTQLATLQKLMNRIAKKVGVKV